MAEPTTLTADRLTELAEFQRSMTGLSYVLTALRGMALHFADSEAAVRELDYIYRNWPSVRDAVNAGRAMEIAST